MFNKPFLKFANEKIHKQYSVPPLPYREQFEVKEDFSDDFVDKRREIALELAKRNIGNKEFTSMSNYNFVNHGLGAPKCNLFVSDCWGLKERNVGKKGIRQRIAKLYGSSDTKTRAPSVKELNQLLYQEVFTDPEKAERRIRLNDLWKKRLSPTSMSTLLNRMDDPKVLTPKVLTLNDVSNRAKKLLAKPGDIMLSDRHTGILIDPERPKEMISANIYNGVRVGSDKGQYRYFRPTASDLISDSEYWTKQRPILKETYNGGSTPFTTNTKKEIVPSIMDKNREALRKELNK